MVFAGEEESAARPKSGLVPAFIYSRHNGGSPTIAWLHLPFSLLAKTKHKSIVTLPSDNVQRDN